eukprot:30920-Pelagococcus_subviridis.AAC.21
MHANARRARPRPSHPGRRERVLVRSFTTRVQYARTPSITTTTTRQSKYFELCASNVHASISRLNSLSVIRASSSSLLVRAIPYKNSSPNAPERRRKRRVGQQLPEEVRPHPRSELRHHVPAAVHGDERQPVLVARDVPAELRAGVDDGQRRTEEQWLFVQYRERRPRGVEKIRPLRPAGETIEPHSLDRLSRALVRHARVRVAVEHDRRPQPRRDVAVEVHHRLSALLRVRVARGVIARVRPIAAGAGPRVDRSVFHV